jgi:hypothetical protein
MPHVSDEVKSKLIRTNLQVTPEDQAGNKTGRGELCYLFSQVYVNIYNQKPKWETIHYIKRVSRNPFTSQETQTVVTRNETQYDREDILVSAALAYDEFSRLVVGPYEDVKIIENGNALADAKVPQPKAKGNLAGIPGYLNA